MKHKSKLTEKLTESSFLGLPPKKGGIRLSAGRSGSFIVLSDRKNSSGEYEVRVMIGNREYEPATYYTDDWDDAVDTAKAMAKKAEADADPEGVMGEERSRPLRYGKEGYGSDATAPLKKPPMDMNPTTNKDDGVNNPKCPECKNRNVARLSNSKFRRRNSRCETEFNYEV